MKTFRHQQPTGRPRRGPTLCALLLASLLLLLLAVAGSSPARADPPPVDPAPPEVRIPPPATLEAERFDRLTFHHPPKPLAANAVTGDWPHLLGPAFDRTSMESPLLDEWPATGPAPIWEIERGMGYAAPAVAGDYLVFIHRLGEKEVTECVHPETGRRYWIRERFVAHSQSYGVDDSARASPTIDGEYVYTLGVASHFDRIHLATGTVVWSRDLAAEFGVPRGFFGKGSSPLALGDTVILNLGADDGPCVAAFDAKTGKLAWTSPHRWGGSYASPIAATMHGKLLVFVFAAGQSNPPHGGLLCIDPSNGTITASVPWRSDEFASVIAASPVAFDNRVFITDAYGKGGALIAIKADFSARVAWTAPGFGSQFSTPVQHDGFLYGFDGSSDPGATLVCYDAATGEEIWRDSKISVGRGNLLRAGSVFLCLGEHGELLKLGISPMGAHVLARASLFHAPETFTPPVLAKGLLYVCQNHRDLKAGTQPRLICYDLRGE